MDVVDGANYRIYDIVTGPMSCCAREEWLDEMRKRIAVDIDNPKPENLWGVRYGRGQPHDCHCFLDAPLVIHKIPRW